MYALGFSVVSDIPWTRSLSCCPVSSAPAASRHASLHVACQKPQVGLPEFAKHLYIDALYRLLPEPQVRSWLSLQASVRQQGPVGDFAFFVVFAAFTLSLLYYYYHYLSTSSASYTAHIIIISVLHLSCYYSRNSYTANPPLIVSSYFTLYLCTSWVYI